MNLCPRFNKRNVTYTPVPHSSATNVLSTSTSSQTPPSLCPPAPPPIYPPDCDMVYSTVVPGPDHQGRLYELLPKMSSEDLHLYVCKQGCLLNGKLPNDNHHLKRIESSSKQLADQPTFPAAIVDEVSPKRRIVEKRMRIVDHVDSIDSSLSTPPPTTKSKTPDVILNGLMKKKKRPTTNNSGSRTLPKSKTVKFFKTDSIDETSSVEHNFQSQPQQRRVLKTVSHPVPLSSSLAYSAEAGSSTDTLENLSQVAVNRITDSDEDSPIPALTASKSPNKSSASEGFVLSI